MKLKLPKFHPAQLEFYESLENNEAFCYVLNAPRQWGKTTLMLSIILKQCLEKSYYGWAVYQTASNAREVFTQKFIPILNQIPEHYIKTINLSDLSVKFANGGRIVFKSSESEVRGSTLDFAILDEYAFYEDSTLLERIIMPMLLVKGKFCIVTSTPAGKNNKFYEIYNEAQRDTTNYFKLFDYKIEDTQNETLIKNSRAMQYRVDDFTYRQEYLAEFLDITESNVFSNIDNIKINEIPQIESTKEYYIGIDLAMTNDRTVITCMSETGEVVAWKRFELNEQQDVIQLANNIKSFCDEIDKDERFELIIENNHEKSVIQILNSIQNRSIVQFNTNVKTKKLLIDKLSIALQNNIIKIPHIYKNIFDELFHYRKKIMNNGNITFGAPSGKHDDCVISLALVLHLLDISNNFIDEKIETIINNI